MAKNRKTNKTKPADKDTSLLSARAALSASQKRVAELESNSEYAKLLARCNALESRAQHTEQSLAEEKERNLAQIAKDFRQGGRKVNRELMVDIEALFEKIAQRPLVEMAEHTNALVEHEAKWREAAFEDAGEAICRAVDATARLGETADQTLLIADLNATVSEQALALAAARRDGVIPPWLVPLWTRYQTATSPDERRKIAAKMADRMVDLARWQLGDEATLNGSEASITVQGDTDTLMRFLYYASYRGLNVEDKSDVHAQESARRDKIVKDHDAAKAEAAAKAKAAASLAINP